jgi:hypothetical protein
MQIWTYDLTNIIAMYYQSKIRVHGHCQQKYKYKYKHNFFKNHVSYFVDGENTDIL